MLWSWLGHKALVWSITALFLLHCHRSDSNELESASLRRNGSQKSTTEMFNFQKDIYVEIKKLVRKEFKGVAGRAVGSPEE